MRRALDVTREHMLDAAVALHCRIQGIDGGTGNTEGVRHAFSLQNRDRCVRSPHSSHFDPPVRPEVPCPYVGRADLQSAGAADSSRTSLSKPEWSKPPSPRATIARNQLADDSTEGDHYASLSGRALNDAQILVVQLQSEAGIEFTSKHRGALAGEYGASRQSAAEHLQCSLHIDAVRLKEHDRLGHQLDVACDDELIGGLDGLPRTCRADMDDRLPDRLEHRFRNLKVGRLAPDHDRQAGLDCTDLATADRRVQHPQPALPADAWRPAPIRRA